MRYLSHVDEYLTLKYKYKYQVLHLCPCVTEDVSQFHYLESSDYWTDAEYYPGTAQNSSLWATERLTSKTLILSVVISRADSPP